MILTKFTEWYDDDTIKKIKLSKPADFNDEFDSKMAFDNKTTQSYMSKYKINCDEFENFLTNLNNNTLICCLSKIDACKLESASMWGLYAKNNTGIALEFNYSDLEERFNVSHIKRFIQKIKNFNCLANTGNDLYSMINAFLLDKHQRYDAEKTFQFLIEQFQDDIENQNYLRKLWKDLTTPEIYKIDMINQLICMIQSAAADANTLLYQVEYINNEEDYIQGMIDAFHAHVEWYKKDKKYSKKEFDQLLNKCMTFYKTKFKNWSNENEFRILDRATTLSREYNPATHYFYEFNREKYIEEKIILDDIEIVKPYFPYPTKIFLGCKFNCFDETLIKIKLYCKDNKIMLYQMHNYYDYERKEIANTLLQHID